MARFAKQDRVFALFYVSLGFVTFPKRAKGGPFSSVLHAASTRVNFSLARPQSGKDGPLSCDLCTKLSQRVQHANAEAKHQRVRAAEAQPQSPS